MQVQEIPNDEEWEDQVDVIKPGTKDSEPEASLAEIIETVVDASNDIESTSKHDNIVEVEVLNIRDTTNTMFCVLL